MVISLTTMPARTAALPGRETPTPVSEFHRVNNNRIVPPFPGGLETALVAMGCFWGAERTFWELEGVYSTHVGYCGGFTKNPTYEEVCSGMTGHAETVRIIFDPRTISYTQLLRSFWENHDPTQWMRQNDDIGTQYRSIIFASNARQRAIATAMKADLSAALTAKNKVLRTEIRVAYDFYYAEDYHQQYLARHAEAACKVG